MMNWKGCGRKRAWQNCKALFRHSQGEIEKNHENLSQDSLSPDRDSNMGPPEREAEVLTTRPRSVR
jgi:hypothetical protein